MHGKMHVISTNFKIDLNFQACSMSLEGYRLSNALLLVLIFTKRCVRPMLIFTELIQETCVQGHVEVGAKGVTPLLLQKLSAITWLVGNALAC